MHTCAADADPTRWFGHGFSLDPRAIGGKSLSEYCEAAGFQGFAPLSEAPPAPVTARGPAAVLWNVRGSNLTCRRAANDDRCSDYAQVAEGSMSMKMTAAA